MDQTLYFNDSMTQTFLRYAEHTHISNQKVLLLIDNLKKGLSEENILKGKGQIDKLRKVISQNIRTCYCIMLHVQILADLAEDSTPYDRFVNGWLSIAAS